MKNNTAILLKKEKLIVFKFKDENFSVDLSDGDLEDSWNSILLKDGNYYDTNFNWDEVGGVPSLYLYKVNEVDGELRVDTSDDYEIKIIKQYGTKKEYFTETPEDRRKLRNYLKEKEKFNRELRREISNNLT